jgi:hypothetical protein
MTYVKPEIAVLGDATDAIRGRQTGNEAPPNQLLPTIVSDCELDD